MDAYYNMGQVLRKKLTDNELFELFELIDSDTTNRFHEVVSELAAEVRPHEFGCDPRATKRKKKEPVTE